MKAKPTAAAGTLTLTIYAAKRWERTQVELRSDAAAWLGGHLLMVSAAGPESSCKALAAALHGDRRVECSFKWVDPAAYDGWNSRYNLNQHQDGYRCYRTRFLPQYGLWQLVAVAKACDFLPVLSEEALWQHLRGARYTTPLLREWVPWLQGQLTEARLLLKADGYGCLAGFCHATSEDLDGLVERGLQDGTLHLGRTAGRGRHSALAELPDLDAYVLRYGELLGRQTEKTLAPLHVPSEHPAELPKLLRDPFPAQAHVITATVKALRRQDAVLVAAQIGVGKSIMACAAVHAHAAGRPYRALVFAPGHLVGSEDQEGKWRREVEETIPNAIVRTIDSWRDLLPLRRGDPILGAEWWIIGRDRAKLGYCWRPACVQSRAGLKCPRCGGVLQGPKGRLKLDDLKRARQTCKNVLRIDGYSRQEVDGRVLAVPIWAPAAGCGEQLWQATREIDRFAPADYIKAHLSGYWKYLVLDEVHQEKSDTSAQANAAGALIAATSKTIALSGSIVGGYAWHLKHLLFRMAPRSLVEDGITWDGDTAFNERYGRIETVVREKSSGGLSEHNRQSRGKVSRSTQKNVRPGIMPALFGRHLLDKAVFLSLAEVAEGLPVLSEECCPVPLDEEQLAEYVRVEEALKAVLKVMLPRGDRRLLSTMLQTLLAYPDYPHGWEDVGYFEGKTPDSPGIFVPVVRPYNLDKGVVRPKERQLVDLCVQEKRAGRQVWVYVQFTNRHDVQGRLEGLLKAAGLRVAVMRSSVPVDAREAWIAKCAPRLDVVISHPKLVETGLDLFDKGGRHNFSTLCFYETGYDTFTLRQASGRSWRLLQPLPCRVVYLYYAATMQDRAMALMGRKLAASEALEGKFSTEGLVALGGEDAGSVEMQLAKSLCGKLDLGDGRRSWERVGARTLGVFPAAELEDEPGPTIYKRDIDDRPAQLELFG